MATLKPEIFVTPLIGVSVLQFVITNEVGGLNGPRIVMNRCDIGKLIHCNL